MCDRIELVDWQIINQLPMNLLNEVVVFYGNSETLIVDSIEKYCDQSDLEKASHILNDRQRHTWILSHAYLRILCAHYANQEPLLIEFVKNKYGKPFVRNSSIEFNLSHTDHTFLIAISKLSVGIDLEERSTSCQVREVADLVLSEDEKIFLESESDDQYLAIWTAKEAYLKAIGVGLVDNMRQINVIDRLKNIITMNQLAYKTYYCPNGEISTVVHGPEVSTVKFYTITPYFFV